jgi:hypothetical protein
MRRPNFYAPLSVTFATDPMGTRLQEEYGAEGLGVWAAMIAAAKRGRGQIVFAHDSDWQAIDILSPPSFTLRAFLKTTGTMKQTSTKTHGRVLYVLLTRYEDWNDDARRGRERERKACTDAESNRKSSGRVPEDDGGEVNARRGRAPEIRGRAPEIRGRGPGRKAWTDAESNRKLFAADQDEDKKKSSAHVRAREAGNDDRLNPDLELAVVRLLGEVKDTDEAKARLRQWIERTRFSAGELHSAREELEGARRQTIKSETAYARAILGRYVKERAVERLDPKLRSLLAREMPEVDRERAITHVLCGVKASVSSKARLRSEIQESDLSAETIEAAAVELERQRDISISSTPTRVREALERCIGEEADRAA